MTETVLKSSYGVEGAWLGPDQLTLTELKVCFWDQQSWADWESFIAKLGDHETIDERIMIRVRRQLDVLQAARDPIRALVDDYRLRRRPPLAASKG